MRVDVTAYDISNYSSCSCIIVWYTRTHCSYHFISYVYTYRQTLLLKIHLHGKRIETIIIIYWRFLPEKERADHINIILFYCFISRNVCFLQKIIFVFLIYILCAGCEASSEGMLCEICLNLLWSTHSPRVQTVHF